MSEFYFTALGGIVLFIGGFALGTAFIYFKWVKLEEKKGPP